jgi:phage FluMu gp28-like protein
LKVRDAVVRDFCREKLLPILATFDTDRRHDLGSDFARTGDGAATIVTELGRDLVRRQRLILEMHNVPFEMQRDVLFYIQDRLPRYGHGAFDAGGNGGYIAEVSNQRYGARISEIKLSQEWYRVNGVAYVEAIGQRTVRLGADEDVVRDHQALSYVGGIIRVPDDMRYKGEDGLTRHGDTAIAGMLGWYASRQGAAEYGYEPVRPGDGFSGDDDDFEARSWWRQPAGSGLRGST